MCRFTTMDGLPSSVQPQNQWDQEDSGTRPHGGHPDQGEPVSDPDGNGRNHSHYHPGPYSLQVRECQIRACHSVDQRGDDPERCPPQGDCCDRGISEHEDRSAQEPPILYPRSIDFSSAFNLTGIPGLGWVGHPICVPFGMMRTVELMSSQSNHDYTTGNVTATLAFYKDPEGVVSLTGAYDEYTFDNWGNSPPESYLRSIDEGNVREFEVTVDLAKPHTGAHPVSGSFVVLAFHFPSDGGPCILSEYDNVDRDEFGMVPDYHTDALAKHRAENPDETIREYVVPIDATVIDSRFGTMKLS